MLRFVACIAFLGLVSAQCPANYFYVDPLKSCIAFNVGGTTSLFADAETACSQVGGHLVSIHSAFENAIIASYASTRITTNQFFVGLSRKTPASLDYAWTDKSVYDFRSWNDINPNGNGTGLCVVVDITNQRWLTTDCAKEYDYACAVTFGCPPSYAYFNFTNFCYYKGNGGNYQTAQSTCRSVFGGNLASIHSDEEQNFISDLVWAPRCGTGPHGQKLGETLLGGSYTEKQGVTWDDQSPQDYEYHWCGHTNAKGSTVVMAAHQKGGGCGTCYDSSWYISEISPTDNSHPYEAFVCKTRPFGH